MSNSRIIKAHLIRVYPTPSQERLFRKSCGIARFSYNWALTEWKKMYNADANPSAYTLIKLQNSIKKESFPWMYEVSKNAPQYAIHNLEMAFNNFFKKGSNYPQYKKKGANDSFVAVENQQTFFQKKFKIKIPKIGWVSCAENVRFTGKVNHVVIKRKTDKWFAVVNIEVSDSTSTLKQSTGDNQAIVGVDFGIKTMMVLSDGTTFENPRALKKNLRRLKIRHRRLSKKQKGSKNRRKAQTRVARHHYRISCIRSNAIHGATSAVVKKYDRIVIEDLNVSGMAKNRKLSQAVADVSFSEIRRQLAYKCAWSGKELIVADRFYPSSKNCSSCGHKKTDLKLSDRTYNCAHCGLSLDRDLNAAKNLASYSPTPKSGESYDCGGRSSLPSGK